MERETQSQKVMVERREETARRVKKEAKKENRTLHHGNIIKLFFFNKHRCFSKLNKEIKGVLFNILCIDILWEEYKKDEYLHLHH